MKVSEESVSIEVAITQSPSIALLDPKKKEELYAFLEREIAEFVPDLSTETSRKQIASLAYKVSRTKTAIDDAGALLKSEWMKKSQAIDASRKEIRDKLDALRDKARKPLTDWETAEEERIAFCERQIKMFQASGQVLESDTSVSVTALLSALEAVEIDRAYFGEFHQSAVSAKDVAVTTLRGAIMRLQKAEQDKIDLARLRAESEARAATDAEAARVAHNLKLAQELADAARLKEEQRKADEEARIAKAAKDAEEKARFDAEKVAREAAEQIDRLRIQEAARIEADHQAELAAERQAREKAEAAQREINERTERDQRVAAEAERIQKEQADKKAKEDAKLAANKKHRAAIMTAAKVALMEHAGLEEEAARKAVLAISTGKIPSVEMRFV